MAENRIEYGLKNVHIAVITNEANGVTTYAPPFKLEGALSLKQNSKSENTLIYADDMVFADIDGAETSEGTMEFIKLNKKFLTDVLGYVVDTKGGITKIRGAKRKPFAILFEIDGDKEAYRNAYYKCSAKPINKNYATKKEKIEDPKIEVQIDMQYSVDGFFEYAICKTDNAEVYNNFYATVQKPVIRAV